MSSTLLAVTALLYLATGVSMYVEGKPGLGAAWICYAGANLGFLWENLR